MNNKFCAKVTKSELFYDTKNDDACYIFATNFKFVLTKINFTSNIKKLSVVDNTRNLDIFMIRK